MEEETKGKKKIETLVDDLTSLEEYIRDLIAFLPVPLCFLTPKGIVLELNPAFYEFSGYGREEVAAAHLSKLFPEKEVESLIEEAVREGSVEARKMHLVTSEGEKVPVSVFAEARKAEGDKVVGFFVTLIDLSEIRKTERELEEKVEELEKFKKIAVGREVKMVELKEKIEALKKGQRSEKEQNLRESRQKTQNG